MAPTEDKRKAGAQCAPALRTHQPLTTNTYLVLCRDSGRQIERVRVPTNRDRRVLGAIEGDGHRPTHRERLRDTGLADAGRARDLSRYRARHWPRIARAGQIDHDIADGHGVVHRVAARDVTERSVAVVVARARSIPGPRGFSAEESGHREATVAVHDVLAVVSGMSSGHGHMEVRRVRRARAVS